MHKLIKSIAKIIKNDDGQSDMPIHIRIHCPKCALKSNDCLVIYYTHEQKQKIEICPYYHVKKVGT